MSEMLYKRYRRGEQTNHGDSCVRCPADFVNSRTMPNYRVNIESSGGGSATRNVVVNIIRKAKDATEPNRIVVELSIWLPSNK